MNGTRADFVDAWHALHQYEPPPGSELSEHQSAAFTFSSDRPVKRIDFILMRGPALERCAATSVRVVGQNAAEGEEADPSVGMLEVSSPTWPSDHRGLAAAVACSAPTGSGSVDSERDEGWERRRAG